MKLIKPSFTIIEQGSGIEGVYKQIEMAGRTCYKSEDKITETSAKEFVDRMIKSGHGAMLEHGTIYLFANWYENEGGSPLGKYKNNKYSRYTWNDNGAYVTTNLRVLVENGWMDDLKYLSIPTEYHARRITVKFVCDRGVTHEFVRHRVFSFAQESTRYCNYSKDKFGSEITCILPPWIDANDPNLDSGHSYCEDDWGNLLTEYYYKVTDKGIESGFTINSTRTYLVALEHSEKLYFSLLTSGWKAQEARAVLPTAVKAELVMTGFVDDWKHFFHLRTAAGAHPQARELAQPLQEEFERRNYIN
jgi:thymidylate synthase (FAD)